MRIRYFLMTLVIAGIMIAQPTQGAVIKGLVTLQHGHKQGGVALAPYQKLANAQIIVLSSTREPVAQGNTDAKSAFEIKDVPAQDGEWLVVAVSSNGITMRGVYTGNPITVDPVMSALAEALLRQQTGTGDFTVAEIEHISARLYEIAAGAQISETATAAQAADALMAHEPFRLTLGGLVRTFSSPGDNMEAVKQISETFGAFIGNFSKLDAATLAAFVSPETQIEFEGEFYQNDELLKRIQEFARLYDVKEWGVDFSRIEIRETTAVAETVEKVRFVQKSSNGEVNDTLNFIHDLELREGKWILLKRYEKKCVPAAATIFSGAGSAQWAGVRPCMLRFGQSQPQQGFSAGVRSVYFAMDEHEFYWRMEIQGDQLQTAIQDGSTPLMFMITLTENFEGAGDKDVISVTGIKKGIPYAVNQVRRKAPDGFPEQLVYLPENFVVTRNYVQGTISRDEMESLGSEFFANARILRETPNGEGQILVQGSPVKVWIEPSLEKN